MSRREKSIAIPTGMIIAALYVVLLVGFSRVSYMRRDADTRAAITEKSTARIARINVSDRCQGNEPACEAFLTAAADPQACTISVDRVHQLAGDSIPTLTLQELQRVLGTEP